MLRTFPLCKCCLALRDLLLSRLGYFWNENRVAAQEAWLGLAVFLARVAPSDIFARKAKFGPKLVYHLLANKVSPCEKISWLAWD